MRKRSHIAWNYIANATWPDDQPDQPAMFEMTDEGDCIVHLVGQTIMPTPEYERRLKAAGEAMRQQCADLAFNWPAVTPAFTARTPGQQISAAIMTLKVKPAP